MVPSSEADRRLKMGGWLVNDGRVVEEALQPKNTGK